MGRTYRGRAPSILWSCGDCIAHCWDCDVNSHRRSPFIRAWRCSGYLAPPPPSRCTVCYTLASCFGKGQMPCVRSFARIGSIVPASLKLWCGFSIGLGPLLRCRIRPAPGNLGTTSFADIRPGSNPWLSVWSACSSANMLLSLPLMGSTGVCREAKLLRVRQTWQAAPKPACRAGVLS